MKSSRQYLYLLSFLEGGSVMACELIGAKLLAPYFGTSLYVWAAVLGITLGGLMTGYFLGGILSKKYAGNECLLFRTMLLASASLVLMPLTGPWVMQLTIHLSLQVGAVISLMVFMFPPLVFMGMVSPIIINLLTSDPNAAGNSAGNVYAISTLGGILFTFLMGFYVIPEFGISKPALVTGGMLAALPAFSLMKSGRWATPAAMLLLLVLGGWQVGAAGRYPENYNVLYESEGILGQIKVVDHPSYEMTPDARMGRGLIVNNTLQTYMGVDNDLQYSIWNWSHYFPTAVSIFPKGSKVLLLGLGGGTLVKQLGRLGFEVEAVEIDRRVWEISVKYFNMDPTVKVVIDDARHFIKTTPNKYDIVIFDTFLSESVPEHLLTLEGFEDVKKILLPDGMVMANFYGFFKGKKGEAARSVYKTFLEAGFVTEILATPGPEENRNLIFLASESEKDFTRISYSEPGFDTITDLYTHFLTPARADTMGLHPLRDAKPRLAKMYASAAMSWKQSYNA